MTNSLCCMLYSMTADRAATSTPTAVKRAVRVMGLAELVELDIELARRATLMGQPGRVSKTHAVVRAEITTR